jgi:hypothetical protein
MGQGRKEGGRLSQPWERRRGTEEPETLAQEKQSSLAHAQHLLCADVTDNHCGSLGGPNNTHRKKLSEAQRGGVVHSRCHRLKWQSSWETEASYIVR